MIPPPLSRSCVFFEKNGHSSTPPSFPFPPEENIFLPGPPLLPPWGSCRKLLVYSRAGAQEHRSAGAQEQFDKGKKKRKKKREYGTPEPERTTFRADSSPALLYHCFWSFAVRGVSSPSLNKSGSWKHTLYVNIYFFGLMTSEGGGVENGKERGM